MTRPSVACLIPAYNEAERLGAVIAAVRNHPLITELLVVDDGSADGTAEVAKAAGAPVLRLHRNGGKSAAVAAGVHALRSDLILLLDGDLRHLTPACITRLLEPVLHGESDVSVSLRGNAPLVWRLIGLDYISGERVLPRRLMADHLPLLRRLPRFGLEIWINRLWLANGCGIAVVHWPNVASPVKARKHGLVRGIVADIGMMRDIFRVQPPLALVRQILGMVRASRTVPREGGRDPRRRGAGVGEGQYFGGT